MNGKAVTVPSLRLPHLRLGAVIAVGLAAFLVGWLALNRGDDAPPAPGSGASAASESELKAFADSVSHPVYWAGPKEGYTYELTRTTNGLVYVRYLPEGPRSGTRGRGSSRSGHTRAPARMRSCSVRPRRRTRSASRSERTAWRSSVRRGRRACIWGIPTPSTRSRSSIPRRTRLAAWRSPARSFPSTERRREAAP